MTRRSFTLLSLLLVSCAHRSETLSADRDEELDQHDAKMFCERWRSLGDAADPNVALARAQLALQEPNPPLREGSCMTRAQYASEALASAETAAKGLSGAAEVWGVLARARVVFAGDRAGAAEAGCKAADLQAANHVLVEECGDLLSEARRREDALVRWSAALKLATEELQRYRLMDKLLDHGAPRDALLAGLPAEMAKGDEQWKVRTKPAPTPPAEPQADAKPKKDDSYLDRPTPADEFNDRVRTRMREMRDEEEAME